MLQNKVHLEQKISERQITLICDTDCPLDILKEGLFQYQKYIGQLQDNVRAQQEKAKAEAIAKSSEEPKIEPIQA